jgi:dTDP-4-dehydrorhamnose reductase
VIPATVKALLFGATSITGHALALRFADRLIPVANSRNGRVVQRSWLRVNVDDRAAVARLLDQTRPRLIIYAHAVCDVAKCEADPAWARDINVRSVANLIGLLPDSARLVYVSSDHVFGEDGSYAEDSEPRPISVYGRLRVEAERLVLARPGSLVVRPGLAVGPSADGRSGHLDWLRYRQRNDLPITIIDDESRSAVWSDDLAQRIMELSLTNLSGVRHVPATKMVSRPRLASHLMRIQNLPPVFRIRRRRDQPAPHLGRVEIRSIHRDAYAAPLPSPLEPQPLIPNPQPPFSEVSAWPI